MKKLLLITTLLFSVIANAQVAELRISPNVITTDKNGGVIEKGDTILLNLVYKNNNSNLRNFYLDFQHQISAINLFAVSFPTAGSTSSALPTGTSSTYNNYYYPGYNWFDNANNNSENGLQNAQNAQYQFVQNQTRAINRINLTFATPNGNTTQLNDGILATLMFRVENVSAGFAYDSIYYNFAYGWDNAGQTKTITMPKPNSAWANLDPNTNALVVGTLQTNANLTGGYRPMLVITDSATNAIRAYPQVNNANFFYLGSEVEPNKTYYISAFIPNDTLAGVLTRAITVSDFTAAQNEFIKQNLDGSFTNTVMTTGMGRFAADLNLNQRFDGGDIALLFAQAIGADTVVERQSNSSTFNIPLFTRAEFDTTSITRGATLTQNLGWNGHRVKFRTGATSMNLDLKYVIPGDINRSHSSQVVNSQNQIQTNSANSFNSVALMSSSFPNTTNTNLPVIDVTLNNLTVTSNNIEIPFNIDTKGSNVSAVQFELVYDASKVKFEEIKSEVPNTWFVFANPRDGVLRFGAIDREMKTPIKGASAPFKLKFSTLENGLDISTKIKVTSNLDASNDKGEQVAINLNTTTIKLTGYNNFN
jgi:hypothetical protein